jgi:drug/metabolite transporter (DMT)-like permease
VNLDRFIRPSLPWVGLYVFLDEFQGVTSLAVLGFPQLFLTSARAVIAAALAAALLALAPQKRPDRADLISLVVIASGVVVGFPLLTALALTHVTSAHSVVFIGLLPLATAGFAVLRGHERPKPLFWLFSGLGSLVVAGFALSQSGGGSVAGDLLMLAAILVCGLGYAEGGKLARRLGGWQVISWALLLASPIMLTIGLATLPATWPPLADRAWAGLAYVSIFSMLVGFIFWYRGLALGGAAGVGQLQLLQPFFGLALAALVLGEAVSPVMIGSAVLVIGCVVLARRFA